MPKSHHFLLIPCLTLALLATSLSSKKVQIDKQFTIKEDTNNISYSADYNQEGNSNEFEIKFTSKNFILKNNLYIVMESSNTDFYINVWYSDKRTISDGSLKVGTYSGNSLFMLGSGLYDGKLHLVTEKNRLFFSILPVSSRPGKPLRNPNYTLKIITGPKLVLPMGNTYTTMIDSSISKFKVFFSYDGTQQSETQKLRFQLNAIRTYPEWQIEAKLYDNVNIYKLNPIFKKTIGGILEQNKMPLCRESACEYKLEVSMLNVHMFNLETYFIGQIEKLSIDHYEEYYDKVYANNTLTVYELPFTRDMSQLDVSVTLIPVTSSTDLFVNINTLPNDLNAYDYKEEGALGKRITIRSKDLDAMHTEKKSLFIAVRSAKPGEYLIRVDALDQGSKGILTPGVVESGKVEFNQMVTYMYMFEVIQTQDISFDALLNINSGDADLYIKQCEDDYNCDINLATLNSDVLQVKNTSHIKDIKHAFTCKHSGNSSASLCQFAIGVHGKENKASYFELSIKEQEFHRLILPGQTLSLNLNEGQSTHIKFSLPNRHSENSQLFMGVDTHYGNYQMFLSKYDQFPDEENNEIQMQLQVTTHGMFDLFKTVLIDESKLQDKRIEGVYFVTFTALRDSFFDFKFFEKSMNQISLHTLTTGKQVRAELHNSEEVLYYSINMSLGEDQSSIVVVNLTSFKGDFIMMANTNGTFPSLQKREFFSENGILELNMDNGSDTPKEIIVGIALHNPSDKPLEGKFQFQLSMSYANKAVQLKPGNLVKHNIQKTNKFFIEVKDDFNDLLILKSIVDGYNLEVCIYFSATESFESTDKKAVSCSFSIAPNSVSLYLQKDKIQSECEAAVQNSQSKKAKCFAVINVYGFDNQGYRIGFTYNNHPFHLVKGMITDGPFVASPDAKLNFVYHAESNQDLSLYFNGKGRKMNVFTKLVRSDEFDDSTAVNFPDQNNHDENNVKRLGFVQNIYYNFKQVQEFGEHPELLISILPDTSSDNSSSEGAFDGSTPFIMQTGMETVEIMRTQVLSKSVSANQISYFSFYNNGNSKNLKVYVMNNSATLTEVSLSRGLTSRAPFTGKPIITKKSVGSVELDINENDLKTDKYNSQANFRDFYIASVRSAEDSNISIYWNNKSDLNYIELTPSEPTLMSMENDKKLYFSFYVEGDKSDPKNNKAIKLYFRLKERGTVYLVTSPSGDLIVPTQKEYQWKGEVGDKGGVGMISIPPTDPKYATNMKYIGFVDTYANNEVNVLVDIDHNSMPKRIKEGFTFPEYLTSHESSKFRLFNPDIQNLDLSISMLTGYVNIYISRQDSVSSSNYDEMYSLESENINHKFIQIQPHKYNINHPSEWFILIENQKINEAGFTISVSSNNSKSPIEPGLTKFLSLGPGGSKEYFYEPTSIESSFEIKLELTEVMEPKYKDQALAGLSGFVSLYILKGDANDKQAVVEADSVEVHQNFAHIKFSIPYSSHQKFGLRLFNSLGKSGISLKLDLVSGGYKLVSMNESAIGIIRDKDTLIYEAYANKDKYVFVSVKECIGTPKLTFFESEYSNVDKGEGLKSKEIKDSHSFIQYSKLNGSRAFIKVENLKNSLSVFKLEVFNESDMNVNPFGDLIQEGDGQVQLDTNSQIVKVRPLKIMKAPNDEFIVDVNYVIYLADDIKVMRYAKNCGKYLFNSVFGSDNQLVMASQRVRLEKDQILVNNKAKRTALQEFLRSGYIEIKVDGLDRNKKYYGIVVAELSLFSKSESMLSPIRTGMAYYDEFTFLTARVNLPIKLIISSFIIFAALLVLFIIIKAYIFGNISKIHQIPNSEDIDTDFQIETSEGSKALTMLEQAYYEEKRRIESEQHLRATNTKPTDSQTETHCQEVEMQERTEDGDRIELDI